MEQVNRTKIEWVRNPDGSQGYTWNPVVGCERGCSYCYARRFAERGLGEYGDWPKGQRFTPRLLVSRLPEPLRIKKPSRIFVCSMGELFGAWVPQDWQERVLGIIGQASWHTFMLLTKYPENLARWSPFPDNCWVGATATDQESWERGMVALRDVNATVRYISAEPLLGRIVPDGRDRLDWLIIGAQTGPHAMEPECYWLDTLFGWAYCSDIPLFLKDNLRHPNLHGERIQEWPKGER
jgi:protein gp37